MCALLMLIVPRLMNIALRANVLHWIAILMLSALKPICALVVNVSHVMRVQLHVAQVNSAWSQYVLQTFVEQMQT